MDIIASLKITKELTLNTKDKQMIKTLGPSTK